MSEALDSSTGIAASPRISVLLALDDGVKATIRCLESIVASIPPALSFELVVVDDATSDGTAAFLERASGDVRIIRNDTPWGRARCLNQAARLAAAPLLLLLRQTIALTPDCLQPLLRALEREPTLGAAQPMALGADRRVDDAGGDLQSGQNPTLRGHGEAVSHDPRLRTRRTPDFVTTSCLLVRTAAFAEAGGFDETYRESLDGDWRFTKALRKAGWEVIYEPASTVVRPAGLSVPASAGDTCGDTDRVEFTCNVCGARAETAFAELGRERPSCYRCGSTVRMRSIVHVLSTELFGKSLALPNFPVDKDIRGVGLSDSSVFADRVAAKLGYVNTFYHQEPRLDITDVPDHMRGTLDFIVSSDVFEHVPPPVSRAFSNARRLLKPGGVLILTVPYSLQEQTIEHFPDLHDWKVIEREGHYELHNQRSDGSLSTYDDLVFHGGPGQTLEMRLFSLEGIRRECRAAGLEPARVRNDTNLAFGVYWREFWSLPIVARRPKSDVDS
jgi:GT2 family glycosyltransferase